MSRPTVIRVCLHCQKEFLMDRREFNRKERQGRHDHFCSMGCSASYYNLKYDKGTKAKKNLIPGYDRTDDKSPFRYYLRKANERRFKETDLDLDYLKTLWEKQQGRCAFTGMSIVLRKHGRYKGKHDNITTASLDRIDSSKGYVKGNVQFISAALNLAKQDMPDSRFRQGLKELFEAYASQASLPVE